MREEENLENQPADKANKEEAAEKIYFFKKKSCSFFDQIDEIHKILGPKASIFYTDGEDEIKAIVPFK